MKIDCAHDELVDLDKLQPNPKNPNKHPDKQIAMLAKIIDYQGQRSPIIVSKRSGFITKGHGRLMAIKKLGWAKAAVDYQDYENEAQEYADIIADNKIAEMAETDMDMILGDMTEFGIGLDFDFDLLGIENFADDFLNPMHEDLGVKGELDISKELDEKNNYIILLFKTKSKYDEAKQKLNIQSVDVPLAKNGNPNLTIQGDGRLIFGDEIIDKL